MVDRFVSVSAGWGYACGLRESNKVKCWSHGGGREPYSDNDWFDEPEDLVAPGGEFSSVSVGHVFACGIRLSGEVECWGAKAVASIEPPGGVFASVSAGVEHVCGIRPGGTPECWGTSQRWREAGVPPRGPFIDVAAGTHFTCGLRPGGEAECWGGGFNEGDEPPGGVFESLIGPGWVCGLRPGGEAECWSDSVPSKNGEDGAREPRYPNAVQPPRDARFRTFSGTGQCGVDYDYKVWCWRNRRGVFEFHLTPEFELLPTPEGEFTWVDHDHHACAVRRADSGVECWDWLSGEPLPAPEGAFKEVWIGYEEYCGLLVSGQVRCWEQPEGSPPPPEGEFKTLDSLYGLYCGLRADGAVECWGESSDLPEPSLLTPPSGEFTKVSLAQYHACGLLTSGEIECWGAWGKRPKIQPPEGEFTMISPGWGGYDAGPDYPFTITDFGYSCGVRLDRSLECWGASHTLRMFPSGQGPLLSPPEGEYTQVGVGLDFACALRVDGKVDCWGSAPTRGELSYTYGDALPEGVWVPPPNWRLRYMLGFRVYSYGEEGAPEVRPFTSISVGADHACGLHADSSFECWRADARGYYSFLPDSSTYVDAGFHNHACVVIKSNGGVDCFNDEGVRMSYIPPTTPDACLQESCHWANDDELEQ